MPLRPRHGAQRAAGAPRRLSAAGLVLTTSLAAGAELPPLQPQADGERARSAWVSPQPGPGAERE